jgi:hypothetical protein
MIRPMTMLLTAAVLMCAAAPALAHDDFRVIGTLTKHQASAIEVKSKQGKTTSIRLDKQTAITQDKKKVDAAELKVGRSVVVDAYGDSEDDLLALEIRIVPPIGGTK